MDSTKASPLGLVVSACRLADIGVWERASPRIIRFIESERYLVVVPDEEVPAFREKSPSRYEVVPESDYVPGDREKLATRLRGSVNEGRVGWYLQQLVKLKAILAVHSLNAPALIWDADTLPLRPMSFVGVNGVLGFTTGREYHVPYFRLIDQLLGLRREQEFSFIAQCLPTRTEWLESMCREIETRTSKPWDQSIIDAIDPNETSSFSEYETLGTYVFKKYAGEVAINEIPWLRNGLSQFGPLDRLTDSQLDAIGRYCAYVAFESYDRPSKGRQLYNYVRRAISLR